MAKSKPSRKTPTNTKTQANNSLSPRKRRRRIQSLVIALALGISTAAGLAAYKKSYDVEHDISVIGNGIPTVVQIHDPSCPTCQKLKHNVAKVKTKFDEQIQFRIASLRTDAGRRLASKHEVGKITLLLFDGSGERVGMISGLQEPEYLTSRFKRLAERRN